MEKFSRLTAAAAVLPRANVDTDIIIPIHRLIGRKRGEFGPFAFEPLRYDNDGAESPEFPLDWPRFRNAQILVCGDNFGCGSSREHAVWAAYVALTLKVDARRRG